MCSFVHVLLNSAQIRSQWYKLLAAEPAAHLNMTLHKYRMNTNTQRVIRQSLAVYDYRKCVCVHYDMFLCVYVVIPDLIIKLMLLLWNAGSHYPADHLACNDHQLLMLSWQQQHHVFMTDESWFSCLMCVWVWTKVWSTSNNVSLSFCKNCTQTCFKSIWGFESFETDKLSVWTYRALCQNSL